ncbi:MAG: septation regulator SpoVG [Deltaproteobacteria bacterium]
MEITDIKVFPVEEEKLKAYVTITFDQCFVVRDLKVIAGTEGLFIAMPAKRRKDGSFKDIAHPLNGETRLWLEEAVLAEYDREMKRLGRANVVAAARPLADEGAKP